MIRYGKIESKNKREIVLLKGYPCAWGRCAFCDYIHDNSADEQEILSVNHEVLRHVTGEYGALEVINSGSVFELPRPVWEDIKRISKEKGIERLCFESYYSYRNRLDELRAFFDTELIIKCGIETFDADFRNKVLKKGIVFDSPAEVAAYFDSVCLLVGIEGQTKEMIEKDIDTMLKFFRYGCVNLYAENTTSIKADWKLQKWFKDKYSGLEQHPNIDVLWNNTDFGVGEASI